MPSPSIQTSVGDDESIVFERLIVEAFRGFNTRMEIDLDASVVVLHGPNGMGKTSVFDALQWLLLGEIPRLREARLRQTDEYIVNAYLPSGQARVEAHVRLGDRRVVLTRTGDRTGSSLSWVTSDDSPLHGEAAEVELAQAFSASPEMDLATSLTACGLLQQDAARLVLETKPRDRFAMFSELLGLGALESFEGWVQRRSKELAARLKDATDTAAVLERRVNAARNTLAQLKERAANRPAATAVATRLEAAVANSPFHYVAVPRDRDTAAGLAAAAGSLARDSGRLAIDIGSAQEDLEGLLSPDQIDLAISTTDGQLKQSRAQLEEQRTSLNAAQTALQQLEQLQASIQRMAAAVIPHVHGDECPVCGQSISDALLRERLELLGGDMSAVGLARQAVDGLESQGLALRQVVATAEQAAAEAHAQRDARRQYDRSLESIRTRLERMDASDSLLRAAPPEEFSEAPEWLRGVSSSATVMAALAQELVAAIDVSAASEEISATTELAEAEAQWQDRRTRQESAAAARRDAELLYRSVQESRVEVVRREFARLTPIAQDVYSRLDPHPTFTEIQLVPELFRAAGTATAQVRDDALDISANPMLVFSAAQANIAALSYVIALNWASGARVPMLLLDDPLQAMDDINVLGFADLCRHLRQARQVMVSTHERRFAELLERKLTPRRVEDRTLIHEFVGWQRTGPLIKSRFTTDQVAEGAFRVISEDNG
jgi:DNA repair exonuclease SbcCD ATPase subunit